MRVLEFNVEYQRLIKKPECDFSNIVAGTVGYLKAKFYFYKGGWDDCVKIASFWIKDDQTGEMKEYAVALDEHNECVIPKEVLAKESFWVSMLGARGGNIPDFKILTTRTKVTQEVK